MIERVVEEEAVRIAEERGWLVRKVVYAGRKGAPDRFLWKGGKFLMVEFKRPGERPNPQQAKEHARLAAAGWKVHVIDNWTAFHALIT